MSSPSKAKGTRWEREVADYLAETIPGVDRIGSRDFGSGDLAVPWPIPHECKNERKITLSEYAKQLKAIKARLNAPAGVMVVKAPRKPVSEAYVVMTLEEWRRILPVIGDHLLTEALNS
ncbi:hypothetical protein [Nonomuraea sp. NPDC023979]|uniref:hypothetical protein n=1 Tax=Nonomuraea sp. NPDC023979 TaxID=3154796 RepID=UPI0033FF87B2